VREDKGEPGPSEGPAQDTALPPVAAETIKPSPLVAEGAGAPGCAVPVSEPARGADGGAEAGPAAADLTAAKKTEAEELRGRLGDLPGPEVPTVPAAAVPAMRRLEARFGRPGPARLFLAHSPRKPYGRWGHTFAAIDLGTNNCRVLIARPYQTGFKVLDGYSRTVCLGEGLTATHRLSAQAMARTIRALKVCARKIERCAVTAFRAVATEACRTAENGAEFIARIEAETGLKFEIITPEEEARLAVESCASLIDRECDNALVFDIGGGSTELAWVDRLGEPRLGGPPPIGAWTSVPLGVVSLTERFASGPHSSADQRALFRAMVEEMRAGLSGFSVPEAVRASVGNGRTHMVGNSGTVTTIAGVMMGLARYDRNIVDGAWIDLKEATRLARELSARPVAERAAHPCVGADRADLLLPGAAILEAIHSIWPCQRLRVADRGLREGVLLAMMAKADRDARYKRAHPRKPASD